MDKKIWQYFIHDLIYILKDYAIDYKKEAKEEKHPFHSGNLMSYYETMEIILKTCKKFKIELKEVGLENFELEDLIEGDENLIQRIKSTKKATK